jgi:hypothetical protein
MRKRESLAQKLFFKRATQRMFRVMNGSEPELGSDAALAIRENNATRRNFL